MATVTIDQANRFGDELYRCRTRRRLSQLDLATRAGTTQRYVSYVERGPSAPGRAMVIRLAKPLELSLRERNELLLAAGYAPICPRTSLDEPPLRSVRDARIGGHPPVVGLARFSYRVLPTPNDLVEDRRHHARPGPGGGRCHLGSDRALDPAPAPYAPAGLPPAPGTGPALLPRDPVAAGDRRVVGRHRSDPRPPSVRHHPASPAGRVDRRRGVRAGQDRSPRGVRPDRGPSTWTTSQ
jgi:transcriptional regulator with XRE-family HTH domain